MPGRLTLAVWLMTAVLTGAVIMVLELAAFRLYAPYFGYSIYVWGSMIGVVMAALAVGYALGGRLADRSRSAAPLYAVVLAGGLYQLAILFIAPDLLSRLSRPGSGADGPLIATLLIFAPPMSALAMASPFVTRLLARAGRVGATAGMVYALSTLGSIAGVFGTSFALVPYLGTRATLVTACAVSLAVGAAGLAVRRPAALLALLPLPALAWGPPLWWSEGTLWARESPYNLVVVARDRGNIRLVLNNSMGFQTVQNEAGIWTDLYFDLFALGPLLAPSRRVLVLGMGAGASIRATQVTAPDATFDAVEIDPLVAEAAERFFGLTPGGRLRIHEADARPWLAHSRETFDIVHVDLFHGGLYLPFYLVTEEFFAQVKGHLNPPGVLIVNVLDTSRGRALLNATLATIRRVFPSVYVVSTSRGGNHEIFAFPRERSAESLRSALLAPSVPAPARELARRAAAALTEPVPPAGTPIFTDDHAPVEEMTRRVLAELAARGR